MGNAPGQPHLSPQSIHHSYAQPAHGIDKGETPLPHLLVGEHVHTFKPTDEELRKLQAQFRSLKVSHGGTVAERLNREAFHHNFAKKLKPQFIDKIFNALDWDHSGVVSFREFVMLTHILFAGTEDEKIDYLFVLYDSNGDGFLSGPEIARLAHGCSAALRSLLRSLDSEKQLPLPTTPAEKEAAEKKFAAAILEEADKDGDGKLSADEFKTYCKKHPQALQELQQLADILRHLLGNEVQLVHKPSPKVARANPTEAAEAGKAGGSPKIPHALEAGVAPGTMTTIANVANLLSPNPIPPLEPPAPAPRPADADFALEREAHKLAHKGGSLDKLAS